MTVSIMDIPTVAAAASLRLRDELLPILGDDIVGMWLHGGTTFADRPARPGDLDVCLVIRRATPDERRPRLWQADPASRPSRISAIEQSIAREYGVAFDALYLIADEVRSGKLPSQAFRRSRRETSWPVFREHWLYGQYVHLHGRAPEELIVSPTRAELFRALDREVEHLERHVLEGDAANPFEATYAILNGCRILHTLETGSPVISKRSAGTWGLARLAERWREPIRTAIRSYDASGDAEGNELLRVTMAPFVEEVRKRLPNQRSRRDKVPRWS
jgi:aminoglycoside adenylyltransferase-like protein